MRQLVTLAWALVHPSRIVVLVICIALAVAARVAVGTVVSGVESGIAREARHLIGGDLEITGARRLEPDQTAKLAQVLPPGTRSVEVMGCLTMARAGDQARPVDVRAPGPGYPLVGQVRLDRGQFPLAEGTAVVQASLFQHLPVTVGDRLRLGAVEVVIAGVLLDEPGLGLSPFTIGPRVVMTPADLERSGLVGFGARVRTTSLMLLPPGVDAAGLVPRLHEALGQDPADDQRAGFQPPSQGFAIRTADQAQGQASRLIERIADYLRLTALLTLLLGAVGVACLVRGHVQERAEDLAIIRLLGATAGRAMAIVWLQCLGLGLAGGLLGAALGAVAAMAVEGTVAALVPGVVVPAWDPASLLLGVVLGTSLGALAGLPSLAAVRRHRPLDQLRGEEPPSGGLLGWFGAGIGIGALVLLAAWDARSWVLGPVIVLALVMTGAVLAWGFHLLLPLLGRLPWPRRGASAAVLHLAMGNLGRQGLGGPVTAAAIAGAGLLVGLLLVYRSSVLAELDPQKDGGLPSLFVIDLQVDEVEDFRAMLTAEAIEDATLAPVVRARLRTAERSDAGRDADQARALRSREQNLSFRDRLGTGETLVAGRFQEGSGIEASLEERWAQRLGYRLGDTVTVDIQGVPVSATVTSLRRVQWTSFRPNFFILLSPSALAEAPQTWIAALPPLAQESRQTIQSRLAARFPGTTILDLTDVARRLAVLVTQIGRIVELTAALALAAAILVLIGMALVSARRRRADAALLRVLGATRGTVLLGLVGEFTLLGLLAGGAGILASVGVGQLLLPRLLQLTPVIGIPTLALSALALAGACALAGALACLGVLRARPLETLRSEG